MCLKEKYHVYLADNGRISMAGLNSKNVEYFAGMRSVSVVPNACPLQLTIVNPFVSAAVDFAVRNHK